MRVFLKENGLSVFFAVLFLGTLVAQSFAGQHTYNAEQAEHGRRDALLVGVRHAATSAAR